jgi:hypothetical protein
MKGNPEVLSRLGQQAESKRSFGFECCTAQHVRGNSEMLSGKTKSARKLQSTLKRHFVRESNPECKTDYRKVRL